MKERFHELGELLSKSYRSGDDESVKVLALEYLNLAPQNKGDWNYGNAIHQANIYLGLIALKNNEVEKAKDFLTKSALTPGSPQLNSYGPNMLLAKKLLEIGEKDVVLSYLKMSKKFWNPLFRMFTIKRWKKDISTGKMPDFKANLTYHITYPEKGRSD